MPEYNYGLTPEERASSHKRLRDMFISQIYSDPEHFIYELLQNADDVCATHVKIVLSKEKIEFLHNGCEFTDENVKRIRLFANSDKEGDGNTTGKFGVGFKSVFSIADKVSVYSGKHNFEMTIDEDAYGIPHRNIPENYTTLFVLPFRDPNFYEIIRNKLSGFDIRTLLFLKHIKTLEWADIDSDIQKVYYKEDTKYKRTDVKRVNLSDSEENTESWVLFSKHKDETQEQVLSVDIAYLLEQDKKTRKYKISPVKNSCFSVLFTTKQETCCNFLINGNFNPVVSRENLKEDDTHNNLLMGLVSDLLVDSIRSIKQIGLLTADFLDILPLNKDLLPEFVQCLYNKITELFNKEALLPTEDKKFITPDRAVILETKKLLDFYSGSKEVLSLDISENVCKYLKDEFRIESLDTREFVANLTLNYLEKQSDDWLIRFYEYMLENRALWRKADRYTQEGVLLSKPIIRLEDGKMIALKEKCFLPNPDIHIVNNVIKHTIAKNKKAKAFFDNFDNISIADAVDYLQQEVLSKYISEENDISLDQYKHDISTITNYITNTKDKKNKLLDFCRKYNLILCTDNKYRKIEDVYCQTTLLQEYFKECNVSFADPDIFNESICECLEILIDKPHVRVTQSRWDIPAGCEGGTGWHVWSCVAFEYPKNIIDVSQAAAFATCLNKLFQEPDIKIATESGIDRYINVSQSLYEWFYRSWHSTILDAPWKRSVQNMKWVLNKNGELVAPSEIQKSDIHESMDFLMDLPDDFFGGKAEKMKQFEEQVEKATGQKVRILTEDEAKEYDELKKQKEAKEQKAKDAWKADVSVEQCTPTDIMFISDEAEKEQPGVRKKHDVSTLKSDTEVLTDDLKLSAEDKKNIGEWGENAVRRDLLLNEHIGEERIISLNTDVGTATGHDLQILDANGDLEKYIEVKSTASEVRKHSFEVSKKQWAIATNHGDKYWIYCVFETGTKTPKIVKLQNPVKMFQSGDLEARPVTIVVTPEKHLSTNQLMA